MSVTMRINGRDTYNEYGFKYLRREIGSPIYGIYGREWPKNALRPILGARRVRYTLMEITLLYDGTEHEYEGAKSNLLRNIAESTIAFSDLDFFFDVSLEGSETKKFRGSRFRELTLTLNAYSKYKTEVAESVTGSIEKYLTVPGDIETPVIVEIIPGVDLFRIKVVINVATFYVSTLTAGQKVVVNGESCTVTEVGASKFKDYDSWCFPVFRPGQNWISVSYTHTGDTADLVLRYKPRWL